MNRDSHPVVRRLDRRVRRLTDWLAVREPELWLVAVGVLLLDLGLTLYGLELGLAERNVLALRLLEAYGVLGLGLVKSGALLVGLLGRLALPDRYRFTVPLGLAVPWVVAAGVNLTVLLRYL